MQFHLLSSVKSSYLFFQNIYENKIHCYFVLSKRLKLNLISETRSQKHSNHVVITLKICGYFHQLLQMKTVEKRTLGDFRTDN